MEIKKKNIRVGTIGIGNIRIQVKALLVAIGALVFFSLQIATEAYKPVVIIHGILDHKHSMQGLADRIILRHPGTNVTVIDKLHGWKSVSPMWYQVNIFAKVLIPIMNEHKDGIHIIGYSQGGLVARGLIQSISNHNIHNFISLSSPQAGQFGDDFLHLYFPTYMKETAYLVMYSEGGQLVSVANYWRDPHHIPLFLNYSTFLPRVNNIVSSPNETDFKNNFKKLKKLVLIGGPDDGIICPWQSSQFGFYDENEMVVEMRERDIYTKDTFGLRSLDLAGALATHTVPGVKHILWHKNETVIDRYIIPYLD